MANALLYVVLKLQYIFIGNLIVFTDFYRTLIRIQISSTSRVRFQKVVDTDPIQIQICNSDESTMIASQYNHGGINGAAQGGEIDLHR